MECGCKNEFDLDQYKPMGLSCNHAICQYCVQNVLNPVCHVCRESFDKNEVKPHFAMINIIEQLSMINNSKLGICKIHHRELNLYCYTCKIKLCRVCEIEGHEISTAAKHDIDEISHLKIEVRNLWDNFFEQQTDLEEKIHLIKKSYLEVFEDQVNFRHNRIVRELDEMRKATLKKFREEMDSENMIFRNADPQTICKNLKSLKDFRNSCQQNVQNFEKNEEIAEIIDLHFQITKYKNLHETCKNFPTMLRDELAKIEFPKAIKIIDNNPYELLRSKKSDTKEKNYPAISKKNSLSYCWLKTQNSQLIDIGDLSDENKNLRLFDQKEILIKSNLKCKLPTFDLEYLDLNINEDVKVDQKFLADVANIISSCSKLETFIMEVSPLQKDKNLFELFPKKMHYKFLKKFEVLNRKNSINSRFLTNLYENCLKNSNLNELTLNFNLSQIDKIEVYLDVMKQVCTEFKNLKKLDIGVFGFTTQQISLLLKSISALKNLEYFHFETSSIIKQENIDDLVKILNENTKLKFLKIALFNKNPTAITPRLDKLLESFSENLKGLFFLLGEYTLSNNESKLLSSKLAALRKLEYLFLNFGCLSVNLDFGQLVENLNIQILKSLFLASRNELKSTDLNSLNQLLKPENNAYIISKVDSEAISNKDALKNFQLYPLAHRSPNEYYFCNDD